MEDLETEWLIPKEDLTSAVENTIPELIRQAKKRRITDEILAMMNEKRKSIRNSIRCKELDHEIKKKRHGY